MIRDGEELWRGLVSEPRPYIYKIRLFPFTFAAHHKMTKKIFPFGVTASIVSINCCSMRRVKRLEVLIDRD